MLKMTVGEEDIWEFTYGEGADKPPTGVLMKEEFIRHYYYSQSPIEVTLLITSPIMFFFGTPPIMFQYQFYYANKYIWLLLPCW